MWDVFGCDIILVDQIVHGKYDCRTVIFTMIFYRSVTSDSSVTGLGVHTRWWMYDNITLHSLCYFARVRPVIITPELANCRRHISRVIEYMRNVDILTRCSMDKKSVNKHGSQLIEFCRETGLLILNGWLSHWPYQQGWYDRAKRRGLPDWQPL